MNTKIKWVIVIVLLFAALFFYLRTIKFESLVRQDCQTNSDCEIVNLSCCKGLGCGSSYNAVNKYSNKLIKIKKLASCLYFCGQVKCINQYVSSAEAICQNNKCIKEYTLNCKYYCFLRKEEQTPIFDEEAKNLFTSWEDLDNKCQCK